ncbi:MAG: KH domain-containing protein [Actinomyces sp.]|nr:MAG: KH domain-containing protein [Actinomyces sp.]
MTKPTMTLTEQADIAERFVTGLAERFATSVTVSRVEVDESTIRLDVAGDDLGLLIGRGGATATAIEELMRTVLQRHAGSTRDARVKLDIGGFRARRNEALAAFVRRVAADVRSTGTAKALEPMGAADRKIVHDVIADEEGVTTTSEGEDPRRRVVIVPDD